MSKLRILALLACVLLPNRIKLFVYRRIMGWKIGQGVRIGLSWIDAERVTIGDGVRIGHFNVIKDLRKLEMASGSYMLNYNFIAAGEYDWPRWLKIGEGAGIMSRHYFDAGGGIEIGEHAVIAGRSTQIWTHEKLRGQGELISIPVRIGAYAYVGASALIAPGASIGDRCVVAIGCVVKRGSYDNQMILVGNPTQVKMRKQAGFQAIER